MPPAVSVPLHLDRFAGPSLAAQVAAQIRDLIGAHVLRAGDKLPSTRALAADVHASRGVFEVAYDQLLAEGWLSTRHGAGTFVATHPGAAPRSRSVPPPVADAAASPSAARHTERRLLQLDTGTPWIDPRYRAWWRRAWRDVADADPPTSYPEAAGLPELRAAIAAYVGRTRGIVTRPEQVMVTGGTTDGFNHLIASLEAGSIAVEDPGYRAAAATVNASRHRLHDIPVDSHGADLLAYPIPADLRAVYVTPAHQHPTGATMSAGRRVELVQACQSRGVLIVEDDYDSHFRYDVAPLPALRSLDERLVIHLGTASKIVMPGLRLGWLIGPEDMIAELSARREATHDLAAWPTQRAFLTMLREGYVDRLVRSARRVYAARSEHLRTILAPFGQVTTPVAGMYLSLSLPAEQCESVRRRAAEEGIEVPLLRDYTRSHPRQGLVIGFGGVIDAEFAHAADVLTNALRLS
ncbi:MAG: PLP-dependent aminotransferase family protein [Ornithinimicrobium sp.]